MKKNMKMISLLIVAVMLALSFAGCSNGEDKTTSTGSLEQFEPDPNKKYDISWTYYQTAPMKNNAVMKTFWEEKFNVNLDVWDIENNRAEEILNLRMSGGEIPDKFSAKTMVAMKNYIDQDVAMEIPMEVLEKYAPNMLKRIAEDVPGALEYCKIDGKLYALPTYTTNVSRNPVVWRGDWLKKVGITKVPETLEEFEQALYKFAKEDPDGNGKNDTYGLSSTGLMPAYLAYGFLPIVNGVTTNDIWIAKNNEILPSAIQPEMKQALALISKWYNDGIIDPEFVTGENQGGYWALSHAFINGRIGLTSLGQTYHYQPKFYETDKLGQNRDELGKLNKKAAEEIVIGNPPIGPNGDRGSFANAFIKEEKIMFSKNLMKDKGKFARILQMLDWQYESKANHLTSTKGIEGKMWEYRERKALNGNTYKEVVSIGQFAEPNALNANFAHTAMSIFEPSFKNENIPLTPYQEWEYSINSDKYRVSNALMTALPSQSKYVVELNKLEEEAYLEIITGKKPVSYFDEFVSQWKKLGGDQLMKEAQEWYDGLNK